MLCKSHFENDYGKEFYISYEKHGQPLWCWNIQGKPCQYRGSWCLGSFREHFVYAPSQWETVLQCNAVSHWLGAYAEWSLILVLPGHHQPWCNVIKIPNALNSKKKPFAFILYRIYLYYVVINIHHNQYLSIQSCKYFTLLAWHMQNINRIEIFQ